MDLRSMEDLDRRGRDQLEIKSQATLSNLDLKAPARARGEYNKGLRFIAKNEYENAITNLSKAISIYPDFCSCPQRSWLRLLQPERNRVSSPRI